IKDGLPDQSRAGRIKAQVAGYEFNYIAWELRTLWQKLNQHLFGWEVYYTESERKAAVIEYLQLTGRIFDLRTEIDAIYADSTIADPERVTRDKIQLLETLKAQQHKLQFIAEPIIERHVAAVLIDEGFGLLGQVLPPVAFHFVETPDVLIVSPRDRIQQDFAISLRPLSIEERYRIEQNVMMASPHDAAYVTSVGGVGIWPAMVVETRWAAVAYEIVAHEWAHHYLFAFPSGQQYLVRPETRIINETIATVFGNAMALKILERFYADEIAQGLVWVPDYPELQDFFLGERETSSNLNEIYGEISIPSRHVADWLLTLERPEAAQRVLNVRLEVEFDSYLVSLRDPHTSAFDQAPFATTINRTRLMTDYLLALGHISAAENLMNANRQLLGLRVLNQAWFAFHGGYQAEPSAGGGVALGPIIIDVTDPNYVGDPIGPAIHELLALAPTLEDFLIQVRDVTTRDELLEALIEAREKWGQ
ncbi:MAG: hypothetical protein CUN55_09330, partial [Phototrophicales bacterium]